MDIQAFSALLFILSNLCLGIFQFSQLVISSEVKATLRDPWLRSHFHDLVNVQSSLFAAFIAESVGLLILLFLLWWIVHRFGVGEKHRLLPIKHFQHAIHCPTAFHENSNTNRPEISTVSQGSWHLQRLAHILENYGIKFRQQLNSNQDSQNVELRNVRRSHVSKPSVEPVHSIPHDDDSVPIRHMSTLESDMDNESDFRDSELEGGVDYATCEWKDPEFVLDDGFELDNLHAGPSKPEKLKATEIHLIQTIPCRHWSASYTHTVKLLCGYFLVFLILIVPHYILVIALKVLKQNLPVSFVRLSQWQTTGYLTDWVNETTSTDQDMWQFVRESFACHTGGDQNPCFTTLNQSLWNGLDQVHRCAESIQTALTISRSDPNYYCGWAIHRWIEQREWYSTIRVTLFIIICAICVSLIMQSVAWPTTSTSCQTYPRKKWWKGTVHRSKQPDMTNGRSKLFGQLSF